MVTQPRGGVLLQTIVQCYPCQIYVKKLCIAEGRPTTTKMVVGHDMRAAAFNLLECAPKAYKLDVRVRVSII